MTIMNRRCETSVPNGRCPDSGIEEYCGFCAFHWMKLSDEQRKVLLSQRAETPPAAPVTNVYEQHAHQTEVYNPPRSRIVDAVVQLLATLGGLFVYTLVRHFLRR